MFYMKLINVSTRDALIYFLKAHGVLTVFHYIPLHTSIGGVQYGVFNGDDNFTTLESERLVRLPIYNNLGDGDIATVIKLVKKFYEDR